MQAALSQSKQLVDRYLIICSDISVSMSYHTVLDVAEMLNVHPRTIRLLIQKGELIAVKISSEYRVSDEDLQDFIKKNRTG